MRSVGATLVKLIATATNGLVSFTTNVIRPVKVTCEFTPVQEGTGDPSPDNVRPISGWTEVNIEHTGACLISGDDLKNFFASITLNTQYGEDENGKFISWSGVNRVIYNSFPFFKPGLRYTFVFKTYEGNTASCYGVRYSDGTTSSFGGGTAGTVDTVTFTTAANKNPNGLRVHYLSPRYRLYYEDSGIFIYPDSDSSINYQKQALPINWQSEAGTVYGGTVTLNEDGSADLMETHYSNIIPPRLIGFDERTDYIGSYRNITGLGFPANVANTIICDKALLRSTQVQPTDGRAVWLYGNTYVRVWVRKDLLSTLDTDGVNEWVSNNPLRICYRRATPITYHFDNIGQLQSFLGTNNIWHNMNGDITVEYWNKQ